MDKKKAQLLIGTPDGEVVVSENFFALVLTKEGVRSLMALDTTSEDVLNVVQAMAYCMNELLAGHTGINVPEDGAGHGIMAQLMDSITKEKGGK